MISLDQVLLLQNKVETAVEKITFLQGQIDQLKKDNDALRAKCTELTKSLDDKTELVSALETTQGKIEEGILTALRRLDTVENNLLDDESSDEVASDEAADENVNPAEDQAAPVENQIQEQSPELQEVAEEIENSTEESQDVQISETISDDGVPEEVFVNAEENAVSYDGNSDSENQIQDNQSDNSNNGEAVNGQFDIF